MRLKIDDFKILQPSKKQSSSSSKSSSESFSNVTSIDVENDDDKEGSDDFRDSSDESRNPAKGWETGKKGLDENDKMPTGNLLDPIRSKKLQEELGIDVELPNDNFYKSQANKANTEKDLLPNDSEIKRNRHTIGGHGDSTLKSAITRMHRPKIDWKSELKRFIGTLLSKNREEFIGSKRHLWKDEYRYGDRSKEDALRKACVGIDVSGSVAAEFPEFVSETCEIAKAREIKELHVVPWANSAQDEDAIIIKTQTPTPSMFEHMKLGGGTEAIEDLKRYIKQHLKDNPAYVVIITDGYLTSGLPSPPSWAGKKCIWLVYDNLNFKIPLSWGKIIHVTFDEEGNSIPVEDWNKGKRK